MNTVGLGKSDFLGQLQHGTALALRGCSCKPDITSDGALHLDVRHQPGCARLRAMKLLNLANRSALIRPGRQ